MKGSIGNDIYIFNIGDGADTISDYENSTTAGKADRIIFGEGITADSIELERVGKNLVIRYGEEDKVTVQDAYNYSSGIACVEMVEFEDGNIDYENVSLNISISDDGLNASIDNVVNLLIQDMSEPMVDSLSSTDELTNNYSANENEQLWAE